MALPGRSNRSAPDQFAALWSPHPVAAGEHPRRADIAVVAIPADDGGVAVGGQRDGAALLGRSNRPEADQLAALLRPHPVAAGEHPRCAYA